MVEKNPFLGATFAERKALREDEPQVEPKQIDADADLVEDKAIRPAQSKRKTRS